MIRSPAIIPLQRLDLAGNELRYVEETLRAGHVSGGGAYTRRCEALLEQQLGIRKVLLTSSCTHALELAALLLDIGPGDEVIVPSFTFPSTANAFALRGAKPVFADIRRDTLNLDETRLEQLITRQTKAVVVMHYAGIGCEMDTIRSIAARHRVPIIEDNALGLYGQYSKRFLGTFGLMSAASFHQTKTFACGEGGALFLNDPGLQARAEILRDKGTNRSQFIRGEVDKYTWVDIGSSYVLSDLLAAFLYAQLERRSDILTQRCRAWEYYRRELSTWAQERGAQIPRVPPECDPAYAMFYLLLPSRQHRDMLMEHLTQNGISATFHYLPLHLSPMGRSLGGQPGDCPVAEELSGRLLRLPFYSGISEEEQSKIVREIHNS